MKKINVLLYYLLKKGTEQVILVTYVYSCLDFNLNFNQIFKLVNSRFLLEDSA